MAAVGCTGTDGIDGSDGINGADGADGADGSDGTSGSDGKSSLLRLDDEPAGSHCANGGKAVHSGVDDNADGVLQNNEIDDTAYICNAPDGRPSGVVEGSLKVTNSLDRNLLANVTEITGDLEVDVRGMPSFALPNLERVGGRLHLWLWHTTTLDLPALTSSGELVIMAPALTTLSGLSSLTTVDDELVIAGCDSLQTLAGLENLVTVGGNLWISSSGVTTLAALAGIATVGGELRIEQNDALTAIDAFNGVTSIGGIAIYANPELTTLNAFAELTDTGGFSVVFGGKLSAFTLPKLATAAWFSIESAQGLQTVSLPALTTVDSDLFVRTSQDLISISMPQLISVDRLWLDGNPALTTVDLSSLTTVASALWITDNASFPTCRATAIKDQLVSSDAGFDIAGNDDEATCP